MIPPSPHFQVSAHRRSPAGRCLRSGFSLVEVALALGVCSFALLAMVGLLPVAIGAAGESMEMARRGKVVQYVSNDLQHAAFADLATGAEARQWTFDVDGIETTGGQRVYYTVTARAPEDMSLPGALVANGQLVRVVLEVASPAESHLVSVILANRGE